MTRLWPEGVPIDVETDGARPAAFHWQGRRLVHAVTDHWIIHDDWWRSPDSPHGAGEIWRHYFQVETADDLLCVLYRDLTDGRWYLERVYD